MNQKKPKALFLADESAFQQVYGEIFAAISQRVEVLGPPLNATQLYSDLSVLDQAEIIFGSWGIPQLDEVVLEAAPHLKAVFLGAGSVKWLATDAFWSRSIPVMSAYSVNAIPVAEFTFAQIILSLKHAWYFMGRMQRERRYISKDHPLSGAYKSKVGLVSLGAIGKRVAHLLRQLEVEVLAFDPFCSEAQAAESGVKLVTLETIFRQADVVSLHTPLLPSTTGLITGDLLAGMKPGATLINTARAGLIRQSELVTVLTKRTDLTALMDVTDPEPLPPDSPLFALPNVFLTPHISGAMDYECARLGQLVLEELDRFLAGQPLRWAVSQQQSHFMA